MRFADLKAYIQPTDKAVALETKWWDACGRVCIISLDISSPSTWARVRVIQSKRFLEPNEMASTDI